MATTAKTQPRTARPTAGQAAADERLPFGVLLSRMGQESIARVRKAVRPLELSAQHYIVMKQLAFLGTASQATLADSLGLDYSNLATVTAELHEAALIERYRHEKDRRRYVVELSGKGTKRLVEADAAIADVEEALVANLDAAEREQFWALLRKAADGVSVCPSTQDAADPEDAASF
jgi:DNA-binding MarR family transcriptional regulator